MEKLAGVISQPPERLRNVCILAHVDHGKTTLSDHLIASNGIISRKSAGQMRFLDSRADEQRRLITMKSSCITLQFGDHYINLLDSPGHVDFASEVSAAARISDGALILVDVVEGIGPQTRQVLRQAWKEKLKVIFVLNKVDRLITELNLDPTEAYYHLDNIVTQINSEMYQLMTEEVIEESAAVMSDSLDADRHDLSLVFDDVAEEEVNFSPAKGNVIFASSLEGWAFDLQIYARILGQKLKITDSKTIAKLQSSLWGRFFFHPSKKTVTSTSPHTNAKPMAIQFVFEQIWKVYAAFGSDSRKAAMDGLGIEVDGANLPPGSEATGQLMAAWLPLSACVLAAAIRELPSPVEAAAPRLPSICPGLADDTAVAPTMLRRSIASCDSDGPLVAFVPKFLAANVKCRRLTSDRLQGREEVGQFVGVCRIFSGKLRPGMTLYLSRPYATETDLPPPSVKVAEVFLFLGCDLLEVPSAPAGTIAAVHLAAASAVAGPAAPTEDFARVLALRDPHTIKHDISRSVQQLCSVDRFVTLSEDPTCPPFNAPFSHSGSSIMRVCVEPESVREMEAMVVGLVMLFRADPAVEIDVLPTGEYVLGCSGEVHLERCLSDLTHLYARVPIKVSDPLFALRETIAAALSQAPDSEIAAKIPFPPWAPPDQAKATEIAESSTADGRLTLGIRAVPMIAPILNWMEEVDEDLRLVIQRRVPTRSFTEFEATAGKGTAETTEKSSVDDLTKCLRAIDKKFQSLVQENSESWEICVGKQEGDVSLWALSVARGARTALVRMRNPDSNLEREIEDWDICESFGRNYTSEEADASLLLRALRNIVSGFDLASQSGPLCEEPVRGVVFFIECLSTSAVSLGPAPSVSDCAASQPPHAASNSSESAVDGRGQERAATVSVSRPYGPFSGQVMSVAREVCRRSLIQRGRCRIMESMLRMDLQCQQDYFGRVCSAIAKRRGTVLSERLVEGSSFFAIQSLVPAAASVGLAHDLRSKSSGNVSLHLQFSHWAEIEEDPFPESMMAEEELEDEGEAGFLQFPGNVSRALILATRKRKGLPISEKLIAAAEKQRTLTKMR